MKRIFYFICIVILLTISLISCKKADKKTDFDKTGLPVALIEYLNVEGYSTNNIIPYEDGYIVEGDIIITKAELAKTVSRSIRSSKGTNLSNKRIIAGTIAQYRTTNIISVTGGARTISVALSNSNGTFPDAYSTALDAALARYNNVSNFGLNFIRVIDNADITITVNNDLPWYVFGGASGLHFPVNGNPNPTIDVHVDFISFASNNNPDQGFLATFLAHEIGHCIGFRHTDYMDVNYSCQYGFSVPPENDPTNVGAVHIPGTPTTADANSWMLACIGTTTNRPFNANDITALTMVYPLTVLYYNIAKSGAFTKSNCGSGYAGSSFTYTVPAGTYTSNVSQTDADQQAQNAVNTNGQAYANTQGTCEIINDVAMRVENNHGVSVAIQFHNVASWQSYWLTVDPHDNNTLDVPPGTYNISLTPNASGGWWSYSVGCGHWADGPGAITFAGVSISSGCNIISID